MNAKYLKMFSFLVVMIFAKKGFASEFSQGVLNCGTFDDQSLAIESRIGVSFMSGLISYSFYDLQSGGLDLGPTMKTKQITFGQVIAGKTSVRIDYAGDLSLYANLWKQWTRLGYRIVGDATLSEGGRPLKAYQCILEPVEIEP